MNNRAKQIIVVVAVFVLALASLGTVIGLIATTGRLEEYANGFFFTLSGSRATITSYDGADTDVVIPERLRGNRVVSVGEQAFINQASTIKTITINSSYTEFTLADSAFKDMTALEEVVLPSNLKKISSEAFSGCVALRKIIIPDTVTEIGDSAFYACSKLIFSYNSKDYSTEGDDAIDEEIFYMPSGLLKIGASAFEQCTSLIGAYFHKDIEEVGDKAFYKATAFTELTVEDNCELATIGASAFESTKLRSGGKESTGSSNVYYLKFPHLVSIGDRAFADVTTNFTYFKVPATVKTIGAEAFDGATRLTTLDFEAGSVLESMGEGVFQDCEVLATINVYDEDGNYTTGTLPDTLKEIPAKAFFGCNRLLYNYAFTIGKDVESIGDGAFAIYSPSSLSYSRYALMVDDQNANFKIIELKSFMKEGSSTNYNHGLLVSSDAENIAVYAYYGQFDATSYNPTADENSLSRKAFMFEDITGDSLNNITEIKGYAFAGVAFDLIRMPQSVKKFGEYVFIGSNMEQVCIGSIGWTCEETSFDLVDADEESDDDAVINVMILQSAGSSNEIENFKYELTSNYGINTGTIDWNRPVASN